ncbi:MAG: T9SS C-terminal target domain-containing protein [Gemmatimonadetes bacterium]|nr:MAG: T9SS C-terminal target domain-containing protein [Gemmatimonadota bacterium]
MSKLFVLYLVLLLCVGRGAFACDEPIAIGMENAAIDEPGGTVTTQLTTAYVAADCGDSDPPGVVAIHTTLYFDERIVSITPEDVSAGELLDGWTWFANSQADSEITVVGFTTVPLVGSGTLFEFTWTGVAFGETDIIIECIYNEGSPLIELPIPPPRLSVIPIHVDPETPYTFIPPVSVLKPNYPNPFNPQTTLSYAIASPGIVHLAIFDLKGRLVTTLVDQFQSAGSYRVRWDGTTTTDQLAPSGVYIAQLGLNADRIGDQKLMLLR